MRCYWLFMLSDNGMAFCDWFLISLVFNPLLTHHSNHSNWNRGLQQLEQPITEYNCKHANISTWHWEAPFTWSCSYCEAIYLALYLSQISLGKLHAHSTHCASKQTTIIFTGTAVLYINASDPDTNSNLIRMDLRSNDLRLEDPRGGFVYTVRSLNFEVRMVRTELISKVLYMIISWCADGREGQLVLSNPNQNILSHLYWVGS